MNPTENYKTKKHSIYLLTYHMVFVTLYRRPLITEEIGKFMEEHAAYLSKRFGGELLSFAYAGDHIHLEVELPPDVAPTTAVNTLKTQLSKEIRRREELYARVKQYLEGLAKQDGEEDAPVKDSPLWAPSYFVATRGTVSEDTIVAYVQEQSTEARPKRKYEKTGKYSKKKGIA